MAILQKEALEYQRSLFELPRFLLSGVTIFSTAASFLIKGVTPDGRWLLALYLVGIVLTFASFVSGYTVITATIKAMRDSNNNDEAEKSVNNILRNEYYTFSWLGGACLLFWLIDIVLVVIFSKY